MAEANSDREEKRRKYLLDMDRQAELEAENRAYKKRLAGLEQENRKMEKEANELAEKLNDLKALADKQQAEINELKAQLARALRHSQNSSKRPSSDIVKPRRAAAEGKRKIGGQPGHEKHDRQPFAPEEINRFENYTASQCPHCQGPLKAHAGLLPLVVQQVELKDLPVEITEHKAYWYWCGKCEELYCPLPEWVNKTGLCGPVLMAWIGYLKGACHASFSTIRKFLRDLLNVRISRGMLAKVIAKVSAALADPWEELRLLLPLEKLLNVDETGHKENGQRLYTWCYRARKYILFKIAETRGTAEILEMLGADFAGVIGCDHFSSYRHYMREFGGVLQFCLAHLIRDVKFLVEMPEAAVRAYGQRYLESLRQLFKIIHRRGTMTVAAFQAALEAQRRAILRVALNGVPENQEARNLAERMRKHGASYFRFITTPGLEPTNNLAEQAIRFVVIDRHVTQGTRSEKGRKWCERIWSVLATCREQGLSAFNFIRDAVEAYFTGAPAPRLLPNSS